MGDIFISSKNEASPVTSLKRDRRVNGLGRRAEVNKAWAVGTCEDVQWD